jgi:UDP-3-O-[3-hydroxymyristoyl] glucosamine N-acyltransferase
MIVEAILGKASATGFNGIHPTAIIHPEATVATDATIGPYAVVDRGAIIGPRSHIMAHSYVGADCQIGEDCQLYPHAILREKCKVGNRVILQPGAVIGSCGFGYLTNSSGHHLKLEQLGNVILEDDVEIGANTTIDRARFKTTRIKRGTKIDNLVQIGHNVELGNDNIIVSQTGIAGSTKTGRHVVMGGQVGIVGHVEIADNTIIASRGGVSKDITISGKYNGTPVMPLADFNRQQVHLRKIVDYVKKIQELETRLSKIETAVSENAQI